MKIERINENQIRCTLTSFDLSVRDLNLGELAYGSEKAKKLFREMIQKASNEVGFEADDIPLMVEAIPLSNESIMLVITKIEDPEELDTRFSKFSPASDEDESPFSSYASELLEGADGLLDLITSGKGSLSMAAEKTGLQVKDKEVTPEAEKQPSLRVFMFDSLDSVCSTSRVAGQVFDGCNTLYKNPATGRYYLLLKEQEASDDSFKRVCNLLTEYGKAVKAEYAAESYYQEHYETIVKDRAVQTLSKL